MEYSFEGEKEWELSFKASNEPNFNLVFKWVKDNGFCHIKF
jgi:hypothetical protein